jgi:hypothetical protein
MSVIVRDKNGHDWTLPGAAWMLEGGVLHVGDQQFDTATGKPAGFRATATFAVGSWMSVRAPQPKPEPEPAPEVDPGQSDATGAT